jgi:hypothetical protein
VQQLTIGGQPQTPGQIGLQVWEFTPLPVLLWNLKVGRPFAGQTNMTGSGSVSPMQPGNAHIQIAWLWDIKLDNSIGELANQGVDTRSLQHYLGHKNIQHTVRYSELSPERFRDFWKD